MASQDETTNTGGGEPELTLYGYPQCPYCARVLRAIEELDLEVPLRNTMQEPQHRSELLEATGRGTVPVLRIEGPDGVDWLRESSEIVRYLVDRFAASA